MWYLKVVFEMATKIQISPSTPIHYRLELRHGVAQEATAPYDAETDWYFYGLHATDDTGALRILHARRLRKMNFDGVYCMAYTNPKNFQEILDAMENKKVFGGKRDRSGVLFEIRFHGTHQKIEQGGIPEEKIHLEQGLITHVKTSSEDRYSGRVQRFKDT